MLSLLYLILGVIPPLVAGPMAGLFFINILKRRQGWYQVPFWVILVMVNLLIMFWVVTSSGPWFSISSMSACIFTPVASIATVLVMSAAWRRLDTTSAGDMPHKRWFTFGLVLIPALQILAFVGLLFFAPLLCKVGLVVCRSS